MSNPFLDDYLNQIREEEVRKTSGTPTSVFTDDPLIPLEEIAEETDQAKKNVLYDVVGSTLWSFADEFGFGIPELTAQSFGYGEEVEDLRPESSLAKFGSAVGSMAGFISGAPMKVGLKGLQYASKPFLKKALTEMGEEAASKYTIGSAKKIAKTSVKEAVDSGIKKEIAEDISQQYFNQVAKTAATKEIGKTFAEKSTKVIDDTIAFYARRGDLTAKQVGILGNTMKKDLAGRPLQNFKE